MKWFFPALAGTSLALASTTGMSADDAVSANLTFTSDYAFRGISQTGESFALQGGFDYGLGHGFYVGTWASNVDQAGFNGATAEVDLYGGVSGSFGDSGLGWDLNALYYYYPDQTNSAVNIDFFEFTPSLTFSGENSVTGSLGVSYSDDYFFESGESFYYSLNVSVPVLDRLSVDAHAGHQTIDDNAAFGVSDYTDWSLGLSTPFKGLNWSVAYVDSDVDDGECFGASRLCEARAVVSATKSF